LISLRKKTLARGARLVELLKQGQYSPLPVEKQVVSIFLGTNGLLDDVPVHELKRFEREIHDYIEVNYANVYESIKKEKQLNDTAMSEIKKAAQEMLATFKSGV